jgi:hypothetical protein
MAGGGVSGLDRDFAFGRPSALVPALVTDLGEFPLVLLLGKRGSGAWK